MSVNAVGSESAPVNVSYVRHLLCMVWAALVGTSVPLAMVCTIKLNSTAAPSERSYHAFYVSQLCIVIGALELLPLAVKADRPMTKPKQWWHLAGGLCSLPAFFTIRAGSVLGSQLVLVAILAALLSTYFILDLVDGRIKLDEYSRIVALLFIFGGVACENLSKAGGGLAGSMKAISLLFTVMIAGVGFALQSRCNSALSESVGSTPRAAVITAVVSLTFSVPIHLYIFFGCNIAPTIDTSQWYLWLLAGFQSAFYTGSQAYLPKVLGFTSAYAVTLVGQLVTSLIVDINGLTGEAVPLSITRVVALCAVLIGSITFNACGPPKKDNIYISVKEAVDLDDSSEKFVSSKSVIASAMDA
jgi:uncharacterized membrane protein YdcZ (DUF606 family)